jgi:hypothetical protein
MWLSIRAGRSVVFGPEWDDADARLAFDAASGDFWILSGLGQRIVEALLVNGPLDECELRHRMSTHRDRSDLDTEWSAVIASTLASALLQQSESPLLAAEAALKPTS